MCGDSDLIAKLSDGLKIMDPSFITCDDISKLLFSATEPKAQGELLCLVFVRL